MNSFVKNFNNTIVRIDGLNLENFLFDLTGAGIKIKKVKKHDHAIKFEVSSAQKSVINKIAEKYNLKVTIVKEYGFGSFIKKLPYCIGAILGIAISAFFIWYSTTFINRVEFHVDSLHICENESECIFLKENLSMIENYLSENGLVAGKIFNGSKRELELMVMNKFPLVKSCKIEKIGTTIMVDLEEVVTKETVNYTKIVAEHNCVISEIVTFSGKALVKAGDAVFAGQTLVESDGNVLPRAEIKAKVWYTGTAWHFANTSSLQRTGNTFTSTRLLWNDNIIMNSAPCNYTYFDTEEQECYITNAFFPLKKQTITYYEVQIVQINTPFADKKEQILQKAKNNALEKTTGTPVECTYSIVTEGDKTKVDCYLQVEEKVGVKK